MGIILFLKNVLIYGITFSTPKVYRVLRMQGQRPRQSTPQFELQLNKINSHFFDSLNSTPFIDETKSYALLLSILKIPEKRNKVQNPKCTRLSNFLNGSQDR